MAEVFGDICFYYTFCLVGHFCTELAYCPTDIFTCCNFSIYWANYNSLAYHLLYTRYLFHNKHHCNKKSIIISNTYKGTLTYSEQFSHIGDSIYADEDPHLESNQLVVSPCIRNYQTPYAVPGVSYPVEVIRDVVVLSDIVPAYGTEFVVYPKYGVETFFNIVRREIFDHSYSSQYLPDDINYFSQCVKYNKQLVSPWVVIIEKLFTPLVIFSYVMLGIILIGFCIRRIVLFFYNKNLP